MSEDAGISIENDIPLYESDLDKIRAVGQVLKAKEGTWALPEVFGAEIAERFLEVGYRADIMVGVTETAGVNVYKFYVRIVGRIDPDPNAEFDHERMAREIRAKMGVDPKGLKDDKHRVSRG